jgi:hypothetical protein
MATASAAPKTAAREKPSAGSEALPWESLRERVRALDPTDQPGLDRIYADAAERIREDEPGALHAIEGSYGSLLEAPLEEGFFTVSAWMRSSHAPAQMLKVIWSHAPEELEPENGHHPRLDPAGKHRRIEAYALREMRKLLEAGKISLEHEERTALVTGVAKRAGETPSMDIGLEAFQLLSALKAPAEIQAALGQRPVEERELIAQVLDPNT